MASTRRKSAAIALAVVGIAGLSLAAAATLTVNAGSLGAGTALVASCDDAVDVDFTTVYNGTDSRYDASEVIISDIDALCIDQTIQVTVTDNSTGTLIDDVSRTVADGDESFALTPNVDAESDIFVAVVIHS